MNINEFKDKHKGERCFVLGNGPSLENVDFSLLEGAVTFGMNGIFKNTWGFMPDYYVCVNPMLLNQWGRQIMELDTVRFLSEIPNAPELEGETVWMDTSLREPKFTYEMDQPIWEGYTVTFVCLQLAYYMGFEEVIMLGVDHDYGVVEQPNRLVVQEGEDAHHWGNNYFEEGLKWHTPDLKMNELAYSLAKNAYKDRYLYNASVRTALETIDTYPLRHILDPVKVSAIVSAYYAQDFIVGCMEDLLAQTLEDMEIVVVAQGNSIEAEIVAQYEKDHDNVVLVLTDGIPPIYEAWNIGVTVSRGEYLTNANTDDRHAENAYEVMAEILDANPKVSLVYHDSFVTWKENETFEEFQSRLSGRLVAGRQEGKDGYFAWPDYTRQALSEGCFIGPQPMWRANLHQKYGLFDQEMKSAGDYEFWMRISKENFYHVPLPLGLYCARLDGVELGDIPQTTEESGKILYRYQATEGVSIRPVSPELVRISMGDEYGYVNREELHGLLKGLSHA